MASAWFRSVTSLSSRSNVDWQDLEKASEEKRTSAWGRRSSGPPRTIAGVTRVAVIANEIVTIRNPATHPEAAAEVWVRVVDS